jgi:hypothetical protein
MKKTVTKHVLLLKKSHVFLYLHVFCYKKPIMMLKLNEKHIYARSEFSFRVFIVRRKQKFSRNYSTLEEAIKARDEFLASLKTDCYLNR